MKTILANDHQGAAASFSFLLLNSCGQLIGHQRAAKQSHHANGARGLSADASIQRYSLQVARQISAFVL